MASQDELDKKSTAGQHVVVIGAGVIGLQTSLFLLEEGYRVTTLAQYFPGDLDTIYTSPWAGGQWRSHAIPGQEQCDWDIETLKYWTDIFDGEEKNPDMPFEEKSGLGKYTSHVYWSEPSSSAELLAAADQNPANLWWAHRVSDFAVLSPPWPSSGIKTGVKFTSFTFNPEKHIKYLLARVLASGGETVRATLPTTQGIGQALTAAAEIVKDETSSVPIFVNATGLAARTFVPDDAMHPIRGQTLLVRGEAEKIYTHIFSSGNTGGGAATPKDERIAYVVPRKGTGTSIIGGTKQVGVWDTGVDEGVSREILGWAKGLAPELGRASAGGELEVLKVQVGLRPGRKGGVRVESEVLGGGGGGGVGALRVVHAYGHSGAGFQNSVGCARKVVGLVRRFVR